MRRVLILFSCLLLIISACKDEEKGKVVVPGGVLSAETMQSILRDMYLAEAYSVVLKPDTGEYANRKNIDSLAVFYKEILEHHKVSKEEFEKSMTYYKRNPAHLDSVYNRVLPQLSTLEGVVQ